MDGRNTKLPGAILHDPVTKEFCNRGARRESPWMGVIQNRLERFCMSAASPKGEPMDGRNTDLHAVDTKNVHR